MHQPLKLMGGSETSISVADNVFSVPDSDLDDLLDPY